VPGFGLTLGYTLFYLSIIVLIPLSALLFKTFALTWPQFWDAVTAPRVVASYRLTLAPAFWPPGEPGVRLLMAWVLVRYQFPGKKMVDALVDLPFALPTAVAGISLTALLAGNGWMGQYLEPLGIQLAFNPNGHGDCADLHRPAVCGAHGAAGARRLREGAGRGRHQPGRLALADLLQGDPAAITPALLTGFAMAFARAVGEYGSVIFIAGNMPMVSEITPLIIIGKLEQYDYAGATAVAVVMLVFSFHAAAHQRAAGLAAPPREHRRQRSTISCQVLGAILVGAAGLADGPRRAKPEK
jgi:sulfate transport system permease protein